jgi:hypothetical protein
MTSAVDGNPQHHTQKMKKRLSEMQEHLREDIGKVDEPQLKAMFETSTEVLGGLINAFGDYERTRPRGGNRSVHRPDYPSLPSESAR